MDKTELENMLSCFWAKVTKRINDYTVYIDNAVKKCTTSNQKAEDCINHVEELETFIDESLGDIPQALSLIQEMQTQILEG